MSESDHRRRVVALIVASAVLIAAPLAVVASDAFTDVPDSNVHHDDITWLADNGVTLGCNPPANDEFCPDDPVLRQQMASFMRRLAENQVVDAATAATASDSDTVDGFDGEDLASGVHMTRDESFVSLPADTTTEVASVEVPPGTYLVLARGSVNSNMAAPADAIDCTLTAGTTTQTIGNFFLNSNLNPGETEETTFMIAHTFDATGTADLSCTTTAAWAGNVLDPTITAVSVQDLNISTLGLSSDGDPNG